MKVHELIAALEKMPPNDDVYYSDDGEHVMDITSAVHVSTYGHHFVQVQR